MSGNNGTLAEQLPFPPEWTDPTSPNAKQATIRDLHHHVKRYLREDVESPIRDAPFDIDDDWDLIEAETISWDLLNFLTNKVGNGLAISPSGAYMLFTRACITTSDDIHQFLTDLPNTDMDNEKVARTLVRSLGAQMCHAHAHELARLVIFREYAKDVASDPTETMFTVDATSLVRTFHYNRFQWKNMRSRYNASIRSVQTAITEIALQEASTVVNNWNNLSPDMRQTAMGNTPNGRRVQTQHTQVNQGVSASASSIGRTRLPFVSPSVTMPVQKRAIVMENNKPKDTIYSPLKHLSPDGSVIKENPYATVPEFGIGGTPVQTDSLGNEIKQSIPKIHSYSAPTKEQGIRWNDRIDGILSFIERVEIWFPSVDSAGIINTQNLEYYCTNGLEAFVRKFADPIHNPRCNVIQLREAIRHVFTSLAAALVGTQAYSLVIQSREAHDGWLLWATFRKHFETDGTKGARSEQHMAALQTKYRDEPNKGPAALLRFVNQFVLNASYVTEYDFNWGETQLLRHFKSVIRHESTQYLINDATNRHLDYDNTISLFRTTAGQGAQDQEQTGIGHTYTRRRANQASIEDTFHHLFNAARREDLRVPNPLWEELRRSAPDAITAVNEARRRLQRHEPATAPPTPSSTRSTPTERSAAPSGPGGGYAQRRQYGEPATGTANLVGHTDEVGGDHGHGQTEEMDAVAQHEQQVDHQFDASRLDDMVYLTAHLASLGMHLSTEHAEDDRRANNLSAENMHFAHLEYYTMLAHASNTGLNISDAGADTTVVGRSWYVEEQYSHRFANLVGFSPDLKKMALPIVTAVTWVETPQFRGLIRVKEAIANMDSDLSLISEYQFRDSGCIVDSVHRKHKLSEDQQGTQRIVTPENGTTIPLQLRSGLMTFTSRLPTREEYLRYKDEAIQVTCGDNLWKPRDHTDDPNGVAKAFILKRILDQQQAEEDTAVDTEVFHDASDGLQQVHFFDAESGTSAGDGAFKEPHLGHKHVDLKFFDASDKELKPLKVGRVFHLKMEWEKANGEERWKACRTTDVDHFLSTISTDTLLQTGECFDSLSYAIISAMEHIASTNQAHMGVSSLSDIDIEETQPYLAWAPLDVIRKTIECTTQLARAQERYPMRRHRKSRHLFTDRNRIHETVSVDPITSQTPAYGGYRTAWVFYGVRSSYIDVRKSRTEKYFPQVYLDFLRSEGYPQVLKRDLAAVEKSEDIMKIQRQFQIKDAFSEANNQQQNDVERGAIRWLKASLETLMNRTHTPEKEWIDALMYLADVHNILAKENLGWLTPWHVRKGWTPDISAFLHYRWRQPVYYLDCDQSFPSSKERPGYFLGPAHHVGDALTYRVRDAVTHQEIYRSVVRAADDPTKPNLRVQFEQSIEDTSEQDKRGGLPTIFETDIDHDDDRFPQSNVHLSDKGLHTSPKPIEKLRPTVAGQRKQRHNATRRPHRYSENPTEPPLHEQFAEEEITLPGESVSLAPNEYEVETILDYRRIRNRLEFLVKWRHFDHPSWEPMSNLNESASQEALELLHSRESVAIEPVPRPRPDDNGGDRETEMDINVTNKPDTRTNKTPIRTRSQNKLNRQIMFHATTKKDRENSVSAGPTNSWQAFLKAIIPFLFFVGTQGKMIVSTHQPPPGYGKLWDPLADEPTIEEVAHMPDRHFHRNLSYIQACDEWLETQGDNPEHDRLFPEPVPIAVENHKVFQTSRFDTKQQKTVSTRHLRLLTTFDNMEQSWVQANALRMDRPQVVVDYASKRQLLEHPDFQWVSKEYPESKQVSTVLRAMAANRGDYGPKFKFGVQVPNSPRHAMELDKRNRDNLWKESMDKELKQINDYETFIVLEDHEPLPEGYRKIPYHMVFDVKFDLRRKSRLVAGGNHTDNPKEDIYSGVVGMETIRLGFTLAAMNGLNCCAADVGNAFLYGKTREKVYIIAGPEFGKHAGKRMLIDKGLYGLKTSAARFHEHLSAKLRKLGFKPSRADSDLWMRDKGDHYEYIATYVDDLLIWSKDCDTIINGMKEDYVLKGVGAPDYYLGGNVNVLDEAWNRKGCLTALSAETYIENVVTKLQEMSGRPKFPAVGAPMAEDYHPESDTSRLLDGAESSMYRAFIGSGNWVVTLGRMDVAYAVNTLARYSMAPRLGHLHAAFRVFGYLRHTHKKQIIIDPKPMDWSNFSSNDFDTWKEFYPDAEEELPMGMPVPKGAKARITVYVDADHAHDKVTRRSVTGIILFVNGTPVKWISKRQKTVETSTYGSELVAARIATEAILEYRYNLRMLGVDIDGPALMLGDNKSVILNTTVPSSMLNKKHVACNYHRVREAVAAKVLRFVHVDTDKNLADILTKPLGKAQHQKLMNRLIGRKTFEFNEISNLMDKVVTGTKEEIQGMGSIP